MVWQWVKRLFRSDLLGPAETEDYRNRPTSTAQLFHFEERPFFTLTTAELMEFDSKVTLGLAIRNGMLKQGKVKVEGKHPRLVEFVQKQFEFLWSSFGSRMLRTKNYGYAGFEVLYKESSGSSGNVEVSGLRDFHPRDVRPLIAQGKVVGISVNSVRSVESGKVYLWTPKSLWLTYRDRNCSHYGESLLEHAYPPWWEKWQRGGAIKLRQMRMMKDAWIGDQVRYPTNRKVILPDGSTVTYRDIMREIAELRQSGGIFGLPSDRDQNGNLIFEYIPPINVDGASQIFDYGDKLGSEIFEGLEVPKEVIEAAESGSGFSGRSVPFIGMLSVLQDEFDGYAKEVDRQILKPLCRLNFGTDDYQLQPQSLIETLGKVMGGEDGEPKRDTGPGPQQMLGSPPGGFRGGILPNHPAGGGEKSNGYGQKSLALSDDFRAHVYRAERFSPRRSPARFGCTVGGVFYPPGSWVDAETLQLASDDELDFIDSFAPDDRYPQAIDTTAEVVELKPSSTQFNLPPDLAARVLMMASRIDENDLAGDGVETEPHITIKYGLETQNAADVAEVAAGFSPVVVRFGPVSVFEAADPDSQRGGPEFDVLKIEVLGLSIRKLNKALSDALPHVDTFPDYKPHCTIAYVKPGMGKFYAEKLNDLRGEMAVFNRFIFSDGYRNKTTVLLDGPMQFADAGQWITIGGREADGKKHAGGFPVQIDENGVILKGGPKGLQGKHVSEIGKHFDDARADRESRGSDGWEELGDFFEQAKTEMQRDQSAAEYDRFHKERGADAPGETKSWKRLVSYQAEKWGMDPKTYDEIASSMFGEVTALTKEREEARVYAAERTGLRIPRIVQLERAGQDHSNVRGLDVIGREIASLFPGLGWGRGADDEGQSNIDYGEKVWDLVKAGQIRISKVSKEFHEKVDEYLEGELRRFGGSYGGNANPSGYQSNHEYDEQFSSK